jgi:predicted Zn-dependent protease with MMP-like domain
MTDKPAWTDSIAPSLDDIQRLAEQAWAGFPEPVRCAAGAVVFRIQDFADDEVLAELGFEDPFDLSGLYQGVDLTQQSALDPAPHTPMVFLYREPILDEWLGRGDVTLGDLVAHVLIHEIGHHFGFSDEAMDDLTGES